MGKNCGPAICKLCGDAHRLEAGKVCQKFRGKAHIEQPKPLALPPPPKVAKPTKAEKMKKATDAIQGKVIAPKDKADKRKEYLKIKARDRRARQKAAKVEK